MKNSPPKWADRFITWFCRPELLEDLQGDLYELYEERLESKQPHLAQWLYIWWVFRSLRFDVIQRPSSNYYPGYMLKHNLTIAARVLWRNKFNTLLNVAGLTIGLTCFLLMGFYAKQEMDFDQLHSKKDRIYRVWVKEDYGDGKVFFNSVTPLIFESVLEENFPEVEKVIQYDNSNYLVGRGEDRYNEIVGIIGPDFFEVFDFQILKGSEHKPFSDRNSLILSESYAHKYFGDDDPIGKTLPIQLGEEPRDFTVSAVFEDFPKSSSFQLDMAISTDNNEEIYGKGRLTAWFNVSPETYLLLKEGTTIESVEAKTQDVIMSYLNEHVQKGEYQMGFQPLTDIHLNPDIPLGLAPVGNPSYVYILGLIGLIVLLTSGVNYATLAIGQSLKRRKEVGVRKVLGALKGSLVRQYLSESWVVAFLAMTASIGLTYLTLPIFNELTGADVILEFEAWHLLLYAGLIALVGLMAGLYPAIILSGLKIVHILSGRYAPKSVNFIRKGMVVFQFVITVFLITSTLIMQKQLNYMRDKDLGYDYQATVSVPLYPDPSANRLTQMISSTMEKGKLLKEELSKHPEISGIGMGSHVFGTSGWGQLAFTDKDKNFRRFRLLAVDEDYLPSFGIEVKEGRSFEPESGLDQQESIIINQAAVDYFGIKDPIGKMLPGDKFGKHTIIGVTDNFNYSSLHTDVEPLVITQNIMPIYEGISDHNYGDSPIPKLVFQYSGNQLSKVGDILDESWTAVFPNEELNFSFVEDNIMAQYESEQRMNRLVSFATLLAILVASLGLLGMTVLMINSRIHEIGIRKVIGASDFSIFGLLTRSFLPQLLIGIVLSVPLTLWFYEGLVRQFCLSNFFGNGCVYFECCNFNCHCLLSDQFSYF